MAINTQIDANKNFINNMQYSPGGPGDIVVVRLFYQWPLFVTGLGYNISNLSGNKRLLTATAAFRNEPLLRAGTMKSISKIWLRARRSAAALFRDRSGIAAIEFAVIVPIMLVMFFGTVEFSSGVAVDRKVTLMARTLSDLTSQGTTATDCTLSNSFAAATGILTPYSSTPTVAKITELLVDPTTLQAKVQWSKAATIDPSGNVVLGVGRAANTNVSIPSALAVGRNLSDLQRSQLSLHACGRLCDGEGRHHLERCRLHPAAAVGLSHLCFGMLVTASSNGAISYANKKAARSARPFILFRTEFLGASRRNP